MRGGAIQVAAEPGEPHSAEIDAAVCKVGVVMAYELMTAFAMIAKDRAA